MAGPTSVRRRGCWTRTPNARVQGQLHSIDDMIVKDLARTYPTAKGHEVQRAMVEGSPHLHERKAWHIDDYTRRMGLSLRS